MRPRMDALVAAAVLALGFAAPAAHGAFGLSSFTAEVNDAADQPVTQAGAHPFVGVTSFTFNNSGVIPDDVRNIRVDLPPGLISNPQATNLCTATTVSNCPADTQIGTEEITAVAATLVTTTVRAPIYNMQAAADQVSDFAFSIPLLAPRTDIIGGVRDTGDSGLFFTISDVAELAPAGEIRSSKLTFWGVPSVAAHDAQRGQTCTINLGVPACLGGGTMVPRTNKPFLSLPTACNGPQTTTLTVDSYAGETATLDSVTSVGASGCENLPFAPSVSVTPGTTQADAPSSAAVTLHVPQSTDAGTLASAHLKDAVVTLPEGMTINPGA
ncbi:MAG: hypothetical protein QOH62_1193, partial [Solirubrobacteraceae bacterium]|nr:hypothetical protein [Solirubrobacteraceae bacterium]